ncbi:MAG: hypothetical protein ACQESJ_11345 [Bacteroidota bacterium]
MSTLLELLKYILPSLIVFLTAYFTIRMLIRNDQKRRDYEIMLKNRNVITPIQLQAYERLTLFLERISPDALAMRLNKEKLTVKQLQYEMLTTIRAEYDHNLSQQVYISSKAWETVKNAKEKTIKLINTTALSLKADAPGIHLSKALLEKVAEQETNATKVAIEYLKKEIRNYF